MPKFYWAVTAKSAASAAVAELDAADLLPGWQPLPGDALGFDDDRITTRIDAGDGLAAKVEALRAHATQVTVGPTGRACALSNDMAFPILGVEHCVLAAGRLGERGRTDSDRSAGRSGHLNADSDRRAAPSAARRCSSSVSWCSTAGPPDCAGMGLRPTDRVAVTALAGRDPGDQRGGDRAVHLRSFRRSSSSGSRPKLRPTTAQQNHRRPLA